MNTENLGISGPGINGSNDPYMHPHLTHPHHLLPPSHSSSIYCSSSNPYAELFPQFSTDFVSPHGTTNNPNISADYLTLQNSIDYVVSQHHPHSHHHLQQQQQQLHPSQQHHHHQLTSSSNGERTPSSVGTGITGSDSSPSHSFGTSSGYSSSVDYYNTPVLNSKVTANNTNASNSNSSNTSANNTSSHSPYDGTSTATTSSPPHSTGYLNTTIKQETMMPPSFVLDPHNSYGTD